MRGIGLRELRIGSLFSGIGGIELGLERSGLGRVAWQVESDPYALAVLARHWPQAKRLADVRTAGRHNLARVDLVCGGFPCQDISHAGRGAGITGANSGLWSEMARIIEELRPEWVLVENVPMLRRRGMCRAAGDLAALGYIVEWDCIPAAALGAPHRRDRLFVLAHTRDSGVVGGKRNAPDDAPPGQEGRRGFGGGQGDDRVQVLGASARKSLQAFASAWEPEPRLDRVAHGIPRRLDRLRCLGNAVVPQVAEWIGKRIMEVEQRKE